ncbi:MAG: DUF389 domain-containing protein [Aquamicrobium sp.]|uniref:DUF389 domain-containing protein n=1 Tax=Mesorhizobium sp. Pch-S TaxID=2082387 RepID=UPI0010109079|nr:DUF389 domain-containing protein [Mesorhizobium sp. Pch-S]MBR2691340.1 DUF389 domain-containing protein [Aquamicrobium sp.]QAZ42394.1 DUF389 domain-containing protein [Mesorhizobium sp. Pch-S]
MLQVRVLTPPQSCEAAIKAIKANATTANLVVLHGAALGGKGDVLLFDVARETANAIVDALRALGIEKTGSISLHDNVTIISEAADRAEAAADGHPADAVIWDEIEDQAHEDADLSWSFLTFLVLATLIASIGRYVDQPILIIGAMVVGPDFAPVAAICLAIARRRWSLLRPAATTLIGGFATATAIAWLVWAAAYTAGFVDFAAATSGPQTQFIVKPDAWSFIIAVLAGCAGVLSLTAAKSSALVGVFISITTVPAVGTIALTLAVGAWDEARAALIQLVVNVVGMIIAGTATLMIQQRLLHDPRKSLAERARRRRIRAQRG